MSYTKHRVAERRELAEAYRNDPSGFEVMLTDGSFAEVLSFRDTPRGRWLRLRRRGGPWVPDTEVEALRVVQIGLSSEALALSVMR